MQSTVSVMTVCVRFTVSSMTRSCARFERTPHQRFFSKMRPVDDTLPFPTTIRLYSRSTAALYGADLASNATASRPTQPPYFSSTKAYFGRWYAAERNVVLPHPFRPAADHTSRFLNTNETNCKTNSIVGATKPSCAPHSSTKRHHLFFMRWIAARVPGGVPRSAAFRDAAAISAKTWSVVFSRAFTARNAASAIARATACACDIPAGTSAAWITSSTTTREHGERDHGRHRPGPRANHRECIRVERPSKASPP